jgi:hypothetical protein
MTSDRSMLPMPVKIDPSFNKLHHLGTVPFKLHVSAGAMTTGKMILSEINNNSLHINRYQCIK